MSTNILTATFGGFRSCRTAGLYQWDYGQVLRFADLDLPVAYEVHFSNVSVGGESVTQIGDADGVAIPDALLQTGRPVYAWVYLHTGDDDGETEYAVTIPVIARPEPSNGTPTPVQQDAITEAIAALNAAVSSAETAIEHYPMIVNGVWAVWDVSSGEYVSTGVQAQGPQGADGQDGAPGQDGQDGAPGADGYSPTVTVTEITGGHRVTITDAEGDHVFDVMDGQGGSGGTSDYTDLTNKPQINSVTLTGNKSLGDIGAQAKITASGLLKGDGNGGVSAATAGTDYGTYSKPSGGIPSSDMASAVQTSLGKADSAYQLPSGGVPSSDMASAVQTSLGKADSAYQKPSSGIPATDLASGVIPSVPVTDVQVNGTSVLSNGVANVPVAGSSQLGVVSVDNSYGITVNSGRLQIFSATQANIKQGIHTTRPIVPNIQDASTFYGLAKAAGDSTQSSSNNSVGTYTETARSKISDMLNAPVTVSGSTPTINAMAGVRYICGEVSTLEIVVPASGIIDVTFESGSTATVLTVTPPTGMTMKWANGFDPTSLEANTVYEINIMDGCYGVVGTWT